MSKNPIFVVQPSLPSLEDLYPYLEEIWTNKILTNCGPFHQRLEKELCNFLGVKQIALFNNGTSALVTALQAANLSGDVITTPYSFVATTHSLIWNNLNPIFVDIEPTTLNLDPTKIEASITSSTTAILAVHCYGHPCDVISIEKIAKKYDLKVIYDAAHAFGVEITEGGSVLSYGDFSALSFHATKVFNTFEGGAVVCHDETTKSRLVELKNFGIIDENTVNEVGSNGKMSEFNSALGLLQLQCFAKNLADRRQVDKTYRDNLSDVKGIRCLSDSGEFRCNYAYFPVLIGEDYPLDRDALYKKFLENNIYTRKYFYPLISDFPVYRSLPSATAKNLPVAHKAAKSVLCLPLYPHLKNEEQDMIIEIIKRFA